MAMQGLRARLRLQSCYARKVNQSVGFPAPFINPKSSLPICFWNAFSNSLPAPASLAEVLRQTGTVILGKDDRIRLAVACILARGHLLIEDVPGVGKTALSHVLATLLGLQYQRIQFTSDLLPADIIGVSIFDRESSTFRFHHGPIFAQVILADEINRASPKAQSALLEAMEEHQVTSDGVTRKLPEPFFVIATQNPLHQVGTFPLPESQLDRFLMRANWATRIARPNARC